jgi:large subunit ribosomal protein L3
MSTTRNVRGLLGTKIGMTQVWDDNNRVIPVTVISAGSNVVVQVRAADTDWVLRGAAGLRRGESLEDHQAARRSLREGRGDAEAAPRRNPYQ